MNDKRKGSLATDNLENLKKSHVSTFFVEEDD